MQQKKGGHTALLLNEWENKHLCCCCVQQTLNFFFFLNHSSDSLFIFFVFNGNPACKDNVYMSSANHTPLRPPPTLPSPYRGPTCLKRLQECHTPKVQATDGLLIERYLYFDTIAGETLNNAFLCCWFLSFFFSLFLKQQPSDANERSPASITARTKSGTNKQISANKLQRKLHLFHDLLGRPGLRSARPQLRTNKQTEETSAVRQHCRVDAELERPQLLSGHCQRMHMNSNAALGSPALQ